jgi:hypothetical protein
MNDLDRVIGDWARLGVAFSAEASDDSPDLERLVIATARVGPLSPRVFEAAVAWLGRYGRWVARDRLAALAATELPDDGAGVLGLLLELAQARLGDRPFRRTIPWCAERLRRLDPAPRPLFVRQRERRRLAGLAEREATDASRRWRLWMRPLSPRDDILRTSRWIVARNPSYQRRADLQGDLRCAIIETLRHDPDAGASATELQRRCGVRSYPPVLKALGQLERSGTIARGASGTSKPIRLLETVVRIAVRGQQGGKGANESKG